jgi:hypothetical protein
MSWQIDTITLPMPPQRVTLEYSADTKVIRKPGSLPIIFSYGGGAVTMRWEGILFVEGQSASYLETNFLIPLANKVWKQVTVSAPDSRYDGNWILTRATFTEEKGRVAAFNYVLEFMKGSQHVGSIS